jgi:sterol desaturase/sphingolipid hydroxylase (fatty acid hydroxylase superfamily)
MAEIKRNPKDSMKSTWRNDKSNWGLAHHILDFSQRQFDSDVPPPVFRKTDKVPCMPNFQASRWVLFHALIPVTIQQLYCWYTNRNFHPVAVFFFYALFMKIIAMKEVSMLRQLGQRYGYLDGEKPRDGFPDHSVGSVLNSLLYVGFGRPLFMVYLAYKSNQAPLSLDWLMLPVEIGVYGVVLDFWFYWYHRLMHQTDSLWKYHRTHHLTKHPNPLLTLYADHEQELFDVAVIPLLTYASMKLVGFPMGFYEWWFSQQFVMFTEVIGHSGLRLYATPPSPFDWALKYFRVELTTEDHDLHHRTGWKNSHNYGKQTKLWDTVFGTAIGRIEVEDKNIDFEDRVTLPLW